EESRAHRAQLRGLRAPDGVVRATARLLTVLSRAPARHIAVLLARRLPNQRHRARSREPGPFRDGAVRDAELSDGEVFLRPRLVSPHSGNLAWRRYRPRAAGAARLAVALPSCRELSVVRVHGVAARAVSLPRTLRRDFRFSSLSGHDGHRRARDESREKGADFLLGAGPLAGSS